jgi:ribosomal protein L11
MKTVIEIAKRKMPDLNTDELDKAVSQVLGTARQMGLEVSQ